jgi:hypothetical protein
MRTALRSVLVIVLLATASSAYAGPIVVGDTIHMADGPGTTGGGEFYLTVNSTLETFITFCLQRTAYINFSQNFTVTGVNTYAYNDPAYADGRDPLSYETAWLYTRMRGNSLTNYDSSLYTHTAQQADDLQNAFWLLEGELPASTPMSTGTAYYISAAQAAVAAGWHTYGDVKVLNLTFPNGTDAQDQLALVPTPVPEPATITLIGSGLAYMVARRRKAMRTRQTAMKLA